MGLTDERIVFQISSFTPSNELDDRYWDLERLCESGGLESGIVVSLPILDS